MHSGTPKKEYTPFLDGIKGLACLSVFIGHYFIAFCVKDIFPMNSLVYRLVEFIFSGSFAVSLFSLISGFLAARKSLNTIGEFLFCCFKRFLRFEVPLLIVIAGIMFLNERGLFFFCEPLADKLENKRIQGQFVYETNYLSLFKKPFWSFWQYDNPLWMICQLFAGGIAIYMRSYALSLLSRRLSEKQMKAARILSFAVLSTCSIIDTTVFAVILGGGLQELYRHSSISHTLLVAGAVLILLLDGYLYFGRNFDYLHQERGYTWAGLTGAVICFCLTLSHARLKGFFSRKPFLRLGKVSFGIYVLHYPLLGILSCRIIYCLMDSYGYTTAVLIAFILTSVAMLAAAIVWRNLIEVPIYRLIDRLPALGFRFH